MADIQESRGVTPVDGTDDREARSKFWIALYTRPRSEKKVQHILDKMGINTYLPIQKQMRQWSDRKKMIDVVVIPMVIFAHIEKCDFLKVINHPLILKPITLPGHKEVTIIPNNQIEKLKYILDQSEIPAFFCPELFSVKQNVKIARGPLKGILGEVIDVKNDSAEIVILIDGLGGVKLTTNKTNLEIVS